MSDITAVAGIGPATAKILVKHGINTAEALATVEFDTLTSIPGFSDARAKTAIAAAKSSIKSSSMKTPARATRKAVSKKTAASGIKASSQASPHAPTEQGEADVESDKDKKHKKNKQHKKDKEGKSKHKKHKKNKKDKKQKKHKKDRKK